MDQWKSTLKPDPKIQEVFYLEKLEPPMLVHNWFLKNSDFFLPLHQVPSLPYINTQTCQVEEAGDLELNVYIYK